MFSGCEWWPNSGFSPRPPTDKALRRQVFFFKIARLNGGPTLVWPFKKSQQTKTSFCFFFFLRPFGSTVGVLWREIGVVGQKKPTRKWLYSNLFWSISDCGQQAGLPVGCGRGRGDVA